MLCLADLENQTAKYCALRVPSEWLYTLPHKLPELSPEVANRRLISRSLPTIQPFTGYQPYAQGAYVKFEEVYSQNLLQT